MHSVSMNAQLHVCQQVGIHRVPPEIFPMLPFVCRFVPHRYKCLRPDLQHMRSHDKSIAAILVTKSVDMERACLYVIKLP